MRILCTGGLGFIGSHFVEMAEGLGHQVEVLDCLNYAGRTRNLPSHGQGGGWHRVDICDRLMVQHHFDRFRPDWVVHLAAESHVGRSIECRDEFLRTNVVGTYTMLEAALEYWRAEDLDESFRFLHVSTDEVYGSLEPGQPAWTERSPYKPNNPYAASKAASDHLVRSYVHTLALPAIITHSSNNYGPRQHPEKLIPTLARQVLRGQSMTLHGDGLHVRDWLHVDDHCAGLLRALRLGRPGDTFNFGGGCGRTNRQIAQLVGSILAPSVPAEIEYIANRAGNDLRYATDISRAMRVLDWTPGPAIERRLRADLAWYMQNPDYELDYGC